VLKLRSQHFFTIYFCAKAPETWQNGEKNHPPSRRQTLPYLPAQLIEESNPNTVTKAKDT
jgi:hypothetical protein